MIRSILENLAGIRVVILSDQDYNDSHGGNLLTSVEILILKDINSIFEPIQEAITDLGGIICL